MRPSTANQTTFVTAQVPMGEWTVTFDGNQKITAGNGTFSNPEANAFSLPAIITCPSRTAACEQACYVANLREANPTLWQAYQGNLEAVQAAIRHGLPLASLIAEYATERCRGGFRWHVSGDLFSNEYTQIVAEAARLSPDVHHWIYTRSFETAFRWGLHLIPNMTLNLSADSDNAVSALEWHKREPSCRICYLARALDPDSIYDLLPPGSVIFTDYPLREDMEWRSAVGPCAWKMVCPVDWFGKTQTSRCGVCKKCIRRPR